MAETKAEGVEGWAILELMGHRRLGGYVREQVIAGAPFVRIDVPARDPSAPGATQFYSGGSIYCLTPTTEEAARVVAGLNQPAPVQRWELPPAPRSSRNGETEDADIEDDAQGEEEPESASG